MPRNILKRFLLGTSAIALLGFPAIAQAQDTGAQADDEFSIEEIVVTSRKRGEALQDVPATVSAFTEADIESIGVSSMRDFAKLVPNLFLIETQNSAFTFVNIRGITQMRNLDPSVAVVIDGVISTSPIGMSQELFDIQQIEVLKGPQGALYGRNAMGGAINITTKKPTDQIEGFVRAGYGNGNTGKVQASISGPIVADTLFGRLAVSYRDSDGFRENVTRNKKGDPAENTSVRGRIIWQPSDNLEADLRVSITDDNSTALSFTDISPLVVESAPGSGISLGEAFGIFSCPGPTCGFVSAGPITGGTVTFAPGQGIGVGDINNTSFPLQDNLLGIDRRRVSNISLLVNWDHEWGTVTSISAWDRLTDGAIGGQPPRTAVASQKNSQWRSTEIFSQELRVTSPGDQAFRWIGGGYLQWTDQFLSTTVQRDFDGIDSLVDFIKRDPFAGPSGACTSNPLPPGGPTDNQGNCVMGFDGDDGEFFAFAVYAQFNYDVMDTVELSFSARYDEEQRDQTTATPDQFLSFPTDLSFGQTRSKTFSSFQPKATIRWTPMENFMAYFTFAKGFRSGGFNRPGIKDRAAFLRVVAPFLGIPLGIEDIFPKQETQGIEGGFKFTSDSGALSVSAAGFFTEVDDYQTFTFVAPLNASQIIIPLDEVELAGVELDARWRLMPGLQVSLGFGYTDSEVKKDSARGLVGNRAPQTPKTTLNVGLQYSQPVNFGDLSGNIFLRGDYQRIGRLFFMPENFVSRDPLNLINLRGGFEVEDSWRIEAWSRNATNKNYFAEGFNPTGLFFYGKLREYGIEITKRF